jgi:phage terminase large subunit GpA-like protein
VGIEEWARGNVVLTKDMGVDLVGPYNPDITPWHLEIFRAFEDRDIDEIVIVGAAQSGKSLPIQIIICYIIDCNPKNILYFLDTDFNARYVSRKRIQKVMDSCKSLGEKVPVSVKRPVLDIDFFGGNLTLAGSKSVGQLGTKSAPLVFRDETAKWTGARNEEAGALELAGERVMGQGRYKIIDLSTPVMAGDSILKQFALSDQGYIYLPCPLCGHYQKLVWKQVEWPKVTDTRKSVSPEEARGNTWYECIGCKGKIRDGQKRWMLGNYKRVTKGQKIEIRGQREIKKDYPAKAQRRKGAKEEKMDPRVREDDSAGEGTKGRKEKMDPRVREDDNVRDRWEIELPGGETKQYELVGGGVKNRRWGIHFSRLYVPWVSWGQLAKQWLEIGDDLSKRQTFYNGCLALPWKVRTLKVDESKLVKHIWRDMESLIVPDGYEYITAGADVQQKEIYFCVWVWREDGARHLIEYGVLPEAINSLEAVASMSYPVAGGDRRITVGALYIDSRYRTTEVEDFCRGHANCYACQGLATDTPRQYGPVSQGYIKTDSRGRKLPQSQWRSYVQIHTASFKEELHTRFDIEWDFNDPPEPPELYISMHCDTEMWFIEHLTAEERVETTDTRGRVSFRWVVKRKGNHEFDATVYAAAAWWWNRNDWVGLKKRGQRKKRRRPRATGSKLLDGLPELGG